MDRSTVKNYLQANCVDIASGCLWQTNMEMETKEFTIEIAGVPGFPNKKLVIFHRQVSILPQGLLTFHRRFNWASITGGSVSLLSWYTRHHRMPLHSAYLSAQNVFGYSFRDIYLHISIYISNHI